MSAFMLRVPAPSIVARVPPPPLRKLKIPLAARSSMLLEPLIAIRPWPANPLPAFSTRSSVEPSPANTLSVVPFESSVAPFDQLTPEPLMVRSSTPRSPCLVCASIETSRKSVPARPFSAEAFNA